jgi:NADH-quinone oxidoreductase subunit J
LLDAEFLAAVQVIVYAGAILVFYLFVLMLLDLPDEVARPRFSTHWPLAGAAAVALVAFTWLAQFETPDAAATVVPMGSVAPTATESDGPALGTLSAVGMALFGPFALPFEIASLVLLAAIVGAVVLARRRAES